MMTLNNQTGELVLDGHSFTPDLTISALNRIYSEQAKLILENEGWKTYKIALSSEYMIRVMFHNNRIRFIELCPFVNENGVAERLKIILNELGGENEFIWGKVFFNSDIKAGYHSVIVEYKND